MEVLYFLGAILAIALLSTVSFLLNIKQQKRKHNDIICEECVRLHPDMDREECKKEYCTYYEEINELVLKGKCKCST